MVERSDLCVRRTESFRGSNTGVTAAYFSIKRRKWIRPGAKWGAQTMFYYYLLPGKYVKVSVSYWNKRDPPYRVTAALVQLEKTGINDDGYAECTEKTIAQAKYELGSYEDAPNEILQDAVIAMPSYHSSPSYDFSKQYPEDVVKDLINRIMRGEEYISRIEYE